MTSEQQIVLVVVGAGASHDCLPHMALPELVSRNDHPPHPWSDVRPSLTKDLVTLTPFHNELISRHHECRPVVDELRRRLTGAGSAQGETLSLEQALSEYNDRQQEDPDVVAQVLAFRFYLRDMLWASTEYALSHSLVGGVTNYVTLVRELRRRASQTDHHLCFVNFNYDFLLEDACRPWGFKPRNLPDYTSDPLLSVVKPHGSILWAWPVTGCPRESYGYGDRPVSAAVRHPGAIIDRDDWRQVRGPYSSFASNEEVLVPALALPVTAKRDFSWPREQREHLEAMRGGHVDRVLTIGWRAAEPHFLELLTPVVQAESRILAVTGGEKTSAAADADFIEHQLSECLVPNQQIRHFTGGFTNLFESDEFGWVLAPDG